MQRRTYIGTVTAALMPDWWPFSDSESSTEHYPDDPASEIQTHPLEHGVDVDAPPDAHRTIGQYLSDGEGGVSLNVHKETDTWSLDAASSGTHSFSTAREYQLAHVETFLPVAGSVISDLRAVPRTWRTNDVGNVTGVEVAWTNGSTSTEEARVEILGFVE